jgi:hypothetical protein
MPESSKPHQFRIAPGESPWAALARELVLHPNSPTSMNLMSQVNTALRPSREAAEQLTKALAFALEHPGSPEAAGKIERARAAWEANSKVVLDEQTLRTFETDARELVRRRQARPPAIEDILGDTGERSDLGYDLGLTLEGLRGTWHRLWAALVLSKQMDLGDELALQLRSDLVKLLGREMTPAEWERLRALAHARAEQLGSADETEPPVGESPAGS